MHTSLRDAALASWAKVRQRSSTAVSSRVYHRLGNGKVLRVELKEFDEAHLDSMADKIDGGSRSD